MSYYSLQFLLEPENRFWAATLRQLGYSDADFELKFEQSKELESHFCSVSDSIKHGISGQPGFIYYEDTRRFFLENEFDIFSCLVEMDHQIQLSDYGDFTEMFDTLAKIAAEEACHYVFDMGNTYYF
jgi:hypothetical protein